MTEDEKETRRVIYEAGELEREFNRLKQFFWYGGLLYRFTDWCEGLLRKYREDLKNNP